MEVVVGDNVGTCGLFAARVGVVDANGPSVVLRVGGCCATIAEAAVEASVVGAAQPAILKKRVTRNQNVFAKYSSCIAQTTERAARLKWRAPSVGTATGEGAKILCA